MSGWTVVTLRGREAQDYEYSRSDSVDTWEATSDIVATMEEDERVVRWTTWKSHVYAYLGCRRYDFEFAEQLLEDYGPMVEDAVVLGANDTSGTGCARYYPRPDLGLWNDQYEEHGVDEEGFEGELALAVMSARHGIGARDPFHHESGYSDERYLENGAAQLEFSDVATDGGHDLSALHDGIRATVEADDDSVRHVGDYSFRALDNWCGSPVSHVAVDYAEEPNWLVIPFDFADVVTDAIAERLEDEPEIRTDGGTQGAVDHDWDEAERSTEEQLKANLKDAVGDGIVRPTEGDVCIDLVTRQLVYVADDYGLTVAEYFEEHDFDLRSYKANAYLPVRIDDPVLGVVYCERSVDGVHNPGKVYPTPRGRLVRIPVENATDIRGDA